MESLQCEQLARHPQDTELQLTKETTESNVIRAWEQGRVRVGERWLSGNLIITAEYIVTDWTDEAPHALSLEHLEPAIDLDPEIILIGTGVEALLPDVGLMAALAERRIGVEIMTTPSACRTYNVLIHEGRRVAVALFN